MGVLHRAQYFCFKPLLDPGVRHQVAVSLLKPPLHGRFRSETRNGHDINLDYCATVIPVAIIPGKPLDDEAPWEWD